VKATNGLTWLDPSDPPECFPDPETALSEPDGLLAVGGDLSVSRLIAGYRHGIFPWFQDDQPILWWSPSSRGVLFPQDFHISRSLRRTIRQNRYQVSMDEDFTAVIRSCAAERAGTGTWITPEMIVAYRRLHEAGFAHSVEVWLDGELAGGMYGVALGQVFFGESMFSRCTDASKVAMAALIACCTDLDIRLIDCQLQSAHLVSLGSRTLPRAAFVNLLRRYLPFESRREWARPPIPSSEWVR